MNQFLVCCISYSQHTQVYVKINEIPQNSADKEKIKLIASSRKAWSIPVAKTSSAFCANLLNSHQMF